MAGDKEPIALKSFSAAQPSGRTGSGSTFITAAAAILKLNRNRGKVREKGSYLWQNIKSVRKLFSEMVDAKSARAALG